MQNQAAGQIWPLGHSLLTPVLKYELGTKGAVKEAKSWEEDAETGFTEEVTFAQRING